jgi:ribosomal protein S21
MTLRKELQEANKDKEILSEMLEKLIYENLRLRRKIKSLSKHKTKLQ